MRSAARAIKASEARLMIAGGVESMSPAPFVMPKATTAYNRDNAVYDTTIGRRFVNKLMAGCFDADVIELNEAFAAQGLAVLRQLGLCDDDPHVNQWGSAIALGHPLGASGARLVTTAVSQLQRTGGRYALCTMCVGVGQGLAVVLERM